MNNNNRYPVIDRDYQGGIYEPILDVPADHWENKNRKPLTHEEKVQLMIDAFGVDCFRPTQHKVCLLEYNPIEHAKTISPNVNTAHWWNLGKIISMGRLAFDKYTFAGGATASYGDYVMYDGRRCDRTKFRGGHMIIIEDRDIIMPVKDPAEFAFGARDD